MKNALAALLLAACAACAARAGAAGPAPRGTYTRNVAIVLYEGVELLDFAGPGEVFQAASRFGEVDGAPAFRVYTVAASKQPLTSQRFVKIVPEFSFADAPRPDVFVIPGGDSRRLADDPAAMAWVRKETPDSEIAMTVCTGAFVLAKTGVMAGKDVTTHHGALANLQRAVPDARVQAGRRFVDNGTFVTTAGVSAGIDGALHVVARLLGRVVADRTARYMEYAWSPEATLAGGYATLNPSTDERGRALQLAGLHADEGRPGEAAALLRELVSRDAHDAGAWYTLGTLEHAAGRYADAADAFRRAAEKPALRTNATYNFACSLARAGRRAEALDALAAAVAAGFGPRGQVEGDEDLAGLRAEPRFAAILGSMEARKGAPKS
jgi:putative intracellular protease/amidase